eukprot:31233-Pelagococcus_subviridis.AAC.2
MDAAWSLARISLGFGGGCVISDAPRFGIATDGARATDCDESTSARPRFEPLLNLIALPRARRRSRRTPPPRGIDAAHVRQAAEAPAPREAHADREDRPPRGLVRAIGQPCLRDASHRGRPLRQVRGGGRERRDARPRACPAVADHGGVDRARAAAARRPVLRARRRDDGRGEGGARGERDEATRAHGRVRRVPRRAPQRGRPRHRRAAVQL